MSEDSKYKLVPEPLGGYDLYTTERRGSPAIYPVVYSPIEKMMAHGYNSSWKLICTVDSVDHARDVIKHIESDHIML